MLRRLGLPLTRTAGRLGDLLPSGDFVRGSTTIALPAGVDDHRM